MQNDKVVVEYEESNALANEVQRLFREAITVRSLQGITPSLRMGYVREVMDYGDEEPFIQTSEKSKEECGCGDEESCDNCESPLESVCSLEDAVCAYNDRSPFKGISNLLTTVKKYEYIALVENAYAQIGNKPFKLKSTKDSEPNKEETKKAAGEFYDFLENFLTTNKVRITELPIAFNLDTLGQVTKTLADSAQKDADIRLQQSLASNEGVMERVFKRANFMSEYIEVIKDTTDYPIGVLWVDDKVLKKERVIEKGKLTFKHTIQCDANRIDPCYFWATEDHKLNSVGRAVFKLEQFTAGDMRRWIDADITGSKELTKNVGDYLSEHDDGYRVIDAMLFQEHQLSKAGMYDVVISRGQFKADNVKQLGVTIPKEYKDDDYIPCEIHFSNTTILRVRVMECVDEKLGVYTTLFRRRGQSIFGYSLHDFIAPFAKMYEGSIDAIDISVGKSVGSIIQIDTGVIENPDEYLKKDPKTGEVTLDLSDDLIVEFNSAQAFISPNFKGVPITVNSLPSNLEKILPVVDFIFTQLERISGIPSILVNANNISSALRTTKNFNAAFSASAKVIQSLLRESENRVLKPSIRFFFDTKASSGDMGDFLLEAEPEILLSDTLVREKNDDNKLLEGVQFLSQYGSLIPQEKLSALINNVGREVYNLNEDLIPGVGPLSTTTPTNETQQV